MKNESVRTFATERDAWVRAFRKDTEDTTSELHARKLLAQALPTGPARMGIRVKNQGGTVRLQHPWDENPKGAFGCSEEGNQAQPKDAFGFTRAYTK